MTNKHLGSSFDDYIDSLTIIGEKRLSSLLLKEKAMELAVKTLEEITKFTDSDCRPTTAADSASEALEQIKKTLKEVRR